MGEIKEDIKKNTNSDTKYFYDITKDYRKMLGITDDSQIPKVCIYIAKNSKKFNQEMVNIAEILNNPETREAYDKDREKMFIRQKAEEERKNKEADAEKIAEEKRNKAERDAKRKEEKDKKKAERKLNKTKKRINKNTKEYIKKAEEAIDKGTESRKKVVYTYTDNLTANEAQETTNHLFKRYGVKGIAALIIAGAIFYGAYEVWNNETIKDKIKTTFAKDNEDTNYDDTLNTVSLNEVEAKEAIEEESIAGDSYDLSTTFTDPFNEGEVQTRAIAINNYFRANNYHNISNDEIANQIKFINGSYQGEAYDIQDSILTTFRDFASNIGQNDTYIGGVSENGVNVGLGLDAFLVDNSPNKKIVIEVAEAFQNLLASKTAQEQVDAANKFLSLEYELMLGLKQNNNGETINFELLSSSEGFVTGLMFQLGNTICPSILKLDENGEITYINNNGKETTIKYEDLQNYYNPESNEEIDYENAWAKYCTDLIATAQKQEISNKLN